MIAILAGVLIGATTPGMIGGINSGLGISIPTDVVVQDLCLILYCFQCVPELL